MVKYEIIKEGEESTKEDRLAAAANLSGPALKLYCYFDTFPLGMTTYLQKDFISKMDLVYRTAVAAFKELIDFGYLSPVSPYTDTTYFYVPNAKNF